MFVLILLLRSFGFRTATAHFSTGNAMPQGLAMPNPKNEYLLNVYRHFLTGLVIEKKLPRIGCWRYLAALLFFVLVQFQIENLLFNPMPLRKITWVRSHADC